MSPAFAQALAYEGGGTYARRPARPDPGQLAQAHMALVRKIAWHVHGRVSSAIDVEDLVQIGMVALVEAANSYEDRGHAFSTYASMRIRGSMIDHLRRSATMCRSAMARRKEIAKTVARLTGELGREPSENQIAAAMGLSPADYRTLADSSVAARQESLDDVYSDHSMWFADVEQSVDQTLEREELGRMLAAHIKALPEREALVLQLYFVEEMNLDEIGQVLNVGAARVCQIKKAALDRLRRELADSV